MPWPLASEQLRLFADGLETVLVVEDKLPFVEAHLKEALTKTKAPYSPTILSWLVGKLIVGKLQPSEMGHPANLIWQHVLKAGSKGSASGRACV